MIEGLNEIKECFQQHGGDAARDLLSALVWMANAIFVAMINAIAAREVRSIWARIFDKNSTGCSIRRFSSRPERPLAAIRVRPQPACCRRR